MTRSLPLRPLGSPGRLLIVDDDPRVRSVLSRLLRMLGHSVEEAPCAEEAWTLIAGKPPDLILLDMELPGRSGQPLLEEIRADPRLPWTPVVMLTGAATPERKLRAIEAGATDFLARPISRAELAARVQSLLELKYATDALENSEQALILLAEMIDARDPCAYGHSERVSLYASLLAGEAGLDEGDVAAVRRGGLFHDIGKIGVPERVLFKPGKLSPEEYAEVREHPRRGRDLLRNVKTLGAALDVVYHHHERMDGSGYPEGLHGDAIPIVARIATIADVFDALKTQRIYRGTLTRDEALEKMTSEVRKGWWDGRLLDLFRGVLEKLSEDDPRLIALTFPGELPTGD